MKKYVMLLALVASFTVFAGSTSAILFNRAQFQAHKATGDTPAFMLTVPVIYKGSMTSNGVIIDNMADVCVDEEKGSYQLYMTMCQPCIDCYPCRMIQTEQSDEALPMTAYGEAAVDPGKITKWNFYVVREDKKTKTVTIFKIDLTDTEESVFFTGSAKDKAAVKGVNEATFFATGKKSDYKFTYLDAEITSEAGDWAVTGKGKQTGYIKSVSSLAGVFNVALVDKDAETASNIQCKLSLTRNASLMKTAFADVFGTKVTPKGKKWEDCAVETPASICEAYFSSEWNAADDGMDAYLESYYSKKKFEVEAFNSTFTEAAEDAYGLD